MTKRREIEYREGGMKSGDPSGGAPPDKIRRRDSPDRTWIFPGGKDSQDADYAVVLPAIPVDLELMIFSRVGILELRKLCSVNRRLLSLVKNGDLIRERRAGGVREAYVFMRACGEPNWLAFDRTFTSHKALPALPSDDIFFETADKESVSARTHLLLCGVGMDGPVIWTYDLIMNRWFIGSSMVQPRCLFASASCSDFAYVAGGINLRVGGVLSSAERYDPASGSWARLPEMTRPRKLGAGFYMDGEFYVIGGLDHDENPLTCGEVYREEPCRWEHIPDMLNGLALASSESDRNYSASPPLVAVVHNELYLFEQTSNLLLLFLKESRSWRSLGPVPVRADINKGWGVGFKSLGDQLLVMGGSDVSLSGKGMNMYTCSPNITDSELTWRRVVDRGNKSHFVQNCTVMLV